MDLNLGINWKQEDKLEKINLNINTKEIKWLSYCMCTSPEGWTFCFWLSAAVTLKDAISSVIYSSPSRLYQDKL